MKALLLFFYLSNILCNIYLAQANGGGTYIDESLLNDVKRTVLPSITSSLQTIHYLPCKVMEWKYKSIGIVCEKENEKPKISEKKFHRLLELLILKNQSDGNQITLPGEDQNTITHLLAQLEPDAERQEALSEFILNFGQYRKVRVEEVSLSTYLIFLEFMSQKLTLMYNAIQSVADIMKAQYFIYLMYNKNLGEKEQKDHAYLSETVQSDSKMQTLTEDMLARFVKIGTYYGDADILKQEIHLNNKKKREYEEEEMLSNLTPEEEASVFNTGFRKVVLARLTEEEQVTFLMEQYVSTRGFILNRELVLEKILDKVKNQGISEKVFKTLVKKIRDKETPGGFSEILKEMLYPIEDNRWRLRYVSEYMTQVDLTTVLQEWGVSEIP